MMRKIFIIFVIGLLASGCATYKFHYGKKPFDQGYVASRDNFTILEYTAGKDNTVPPDIKLAKERLQRRKKIVEHYYKRMGYIENNFKKNFWGPVDLFLGTIGGIFRLPFVIVSEYRYEHNPKYRDRIDKLEKDKEDREEARIKKLKDKLNNYIQKDLAKENSHVVSH